MAMGKPFLIKWWALEYVLLPPKYLEDLKHADVHNLNFFRSISDVCWFMLQRTLS